MSGTYSVTDAEKISDLVQQLQMQLSHTDLWEPSTVHVLADTIQHKSLLALQPKSPAINALYVELPNSSIINAFTSCLYI